MRTLQEVPDGSEPYGSTRLPVPLPCSGSVLFLLPRRLRLPTRRPQAALERTSGHSERPLSSTIGGFVRRYQAVIGPGMLLALLAAGCGDAAPTAPTAPAPARPVPAAATDAGPATGLAGSLAMNGSNVAVGGAPDLDAADGVTLKATAPDPVSPVDDEEIADLRATLVAANAEPSLKEDMVAGVVIPFTYRFELYADGAAAALNEGTVEQGAGVTTYSVPVKLENDVRYRWRVRAEYGESTGPWSNEATFRTPPASIAPPIPTSPADGATDVWPVVLQVTNGETSGRVGRVVMTFEVSTDTAFGSPMVLRQAAGSGRTSVELSADRLQPETTYHWRVVARDDLGTVSEHSAVFSFTTSRVTIGPPTATAPRNGATGVRKPIVLRVRNGATRGPVGAVTMTFQIAADAAFGTLVDSIEQPAGQQSTSVRPEVELEKETTYHWRVMARDDRGHASEWSAGFRFTTARASGDEIDVSEVTWLHTNVGGWTATSTITNVRIRDVPAGGICIEHTKAGSWPGIRTRGGANLAGNPWVFGKVKGRWYAATYEWLRPGQTCKLTVAGHKRPSRELGPHIKRPPLARWVPRSGDLVGFMVSTPARLGPEGRLRERSNIVVVRWP